MQGIDTALHAYGYAGLALGVLLESAGIPLPGETALIAAAFAAAHGRMTLPIVIAVAASAGILGDNLGYAVGRRLGRPWVEHYGRRLLLTPPRLERVDRFFERYGPPAVALARFVTGVRVVAALSAGVGRMPWRVFVRYNVLGAVLWASAVGIGGYALGKGWRGLAHVLGPGAVAIAALVGGTALVVWMFGRVRREWAETGPRARRHVWHALWAVVFGLAVAGFLDVAEDVRMHETAAFDDAVRGWVLTHQTPLLHALFHGVTWLGSAPVVAVLAVALTGSLWLRRRRAAAEAVGSAAFAAAVLVAVLKPLIGRLRPPGAGLVGTLTYSFPSGHATATTTLFVVAAYVLSRERLVSRQVAAASLLLPTAVGVSRVYLDVHWATDVLGGWAAGTVLALVAAALYERLRAGRREVGSHPDVSARSGDVLDSGRQ